MNYNKELRVMQGFLLHTAADTTNLGIVGPIFDDLGNFEFVPIYNSYGNGENRTYSQIPSRNTEYGKFLSDFVTPKFSNREVHTDPEFENFTYAQPVDDNPRSKVLEKLREGNMVFFVFSLAPYDPYVYAHKELIKSFQSGKKNKYITGFFTVQGVAKVTVFKSEPRLALALFDVAKREEGELFFDQRDLSAELELLQKYGYIMRDGDGYMLTQDPEKPKSRREIVSRSGKLMVELIDSYMPDKEEAQREFIEKGFVDISSISGFITEADVRSNFHYKRLKRLDIDSFVLIKGYFDKSALLDRAVRLTDGFDQVSFVLNSLGKDILKREKDTLRGFRWIDGNSVRLVAEEIKKRNPEVMPKISHLLR